MVLNRVITVTTVLNMVITVTMVLDKVITVAMVLNKIITVAMVLDKVITVTMVLDKIITVTMVLDNVIVASCMKYISTLASNENATLLFLFLKLYYFTQIHPIYVTYSIDIYTNTYQQIKFQNYGTNCILSH